MQPDRIIAFAMASGEGSRLRRFQTAGRSADVHDGKGPRGVHDRFAVRGCWRQRIIRFAA